MQTVIIGNSAAGVKAAETFRKYDHHSTLVMVSKEDGPAYSKVLLPYFLRRRIPYENLYIRTDTYYEQLGITTAFGSSVNAVEVNDQRVRLENGRSIPYDRLLIASGASAVKPPIENLEGPGVYHLWTLDDATSLEPLLQPGKRILVIGSGFVALQAAWAALYRGVEVTIFELMERIMPKVLDTEGSRLLQQKIVSCGAAVRTGVLTERIERCHDGTIRVFSKGESPIPVDLIIVGAGVRPNTEFLSSSDVFKDERSGAVLVDTTMRTSVSNIWAAGDVASGPSTFGEAHIPCALWPTAIEHGKISGANMAGKAFEYQGSLNMNVTEMFDLTVASMGLFQENGEHATDGVAGHSTGGKINRQKHVFFDQTRKRYIKIRTQNNRPVGGVLLGEPNDVRLFGALRTSIRKKREIESMESYLDSLISDPFSLQTYYTSQSAGRPYR